MNAQTKVSKYSKLLELVTAPCKSDLLSLKNQEIAESICKEVTFNKYNLLIGVAYYISLITGEEYRPFVIDIYTNELTSVYGVKKENAEEDIYNDFYGKNVGIREKIRALYNVHENYIILGSSNNYEKGLHHITLINYNDFSYDFGLRTDHSFINRTYSKYNNEIYKYYDAVMNYRFDNKKMYISESEMKGIADSIIIDDLIEKEDDIFQKIKIK